jgi:hypothetical protein
MVEEHGLADSRLAAKHQHVAPASTHRRGKSVENVALANTVQYAQPWDVVIRHSRSIIAGHASSM